MKSKDIAQSGILIALTLAILFAASLIPINTLSILAIASCLVPIAIIRTSIKYGVLVYLCSSILSFLFIPLNIALMYSMFFGVYGIIKFFIEKINNLSYEILLKLITFNCILFAAYFLFKLFITDFNIKLPIWIIILICQFAFLIYDYALTIVISYFLNRINSHIK
ncbi:hypothetical protein [uncultured Clostridium sp.]|uniref:hypothetical protein n=1 Tax=uncultured Clostridium sp. TaxID=59620 RepID=UPI0025FDD339|nr:hypothetical protein [uncultured Clostridium sp.]